MVEQCCNNIVNMAEQPCWQHCSLDVAQHCSRGAAQHCSRLLTNCNRLRVFSRVTNGCRYFLPAVQHHNCPSSRHVRWRRRRGEQLATLQCRFTGPHANSPGRSSPTMEGTSAEDVEPREYDPREHQRIRHECHTGAAARYGIVFYWLKAVAYSCGHAPPPPESPKTFFDEVHC